MEQITKQRYVLVWCMKVYPPEDTDLANFNREIRNWLAQNVGSGSWETEYPAYIDYAFYKECLSVICGRLWVEGDR